jgi:hypothetical protein
MENMGLSVVIQKYNVVHEDNFNRYIIIDEVET